MNDKTTIDAWRIGFLEHCAVQAAWAKAYDEVMLESMLPTESDLEDLLPVWVRIRAAVIDNNRLSAGELAFVIDHCEGNTNLGPWQRWLWDKIAADLPMMDCEDSGRELDWSEMMATAIRTVWPSEQFRNDYMRMRRMYDFGSDWDESAKPSLRAVK